jgi:alpha-glucosidase
MPDSWDESKVIAGIPGEYIIVARRSGENWFVAGNTNEERRTVPVKLDFLEGGEYKLISYQDTRETDYKTNKETYEIEIQEVDCKSVINMNMAPGGGYAMRLYSIN